MTRPKAWAATNDGLDSYAIRLNEFGEVWEDFVSDNVVHPRKGMTGNPQTWAGGLKRYSKHQAGILAVLRTRIDAYPTYYFARIERAKEGFEEWRRVVPIPSLRRSRQEAARTYDRGDVVLPVIPEVSEQHQPVLIEGIVSVIRLMALDGIDEGLIKSGQLWNDVLREFWERSAQVEGQVAPLFSTRRGEIPNQIVKQRRKVADKVARVQSKSSWGFAQNLGFVEIVSALAVEIGRGEAIRVGSEELACLNLEVVQVELRSLEALPKRFHGDVSR